MAFLCADSKLDFVCLVTAILTIAYCYVKYLYGYWRRKGVDFVPPIFPFGNLAKCICLKSSLRDVLAEIYHSSNKPFIGLYVGLRPVLIIRDVELMHRIMVKDFGSFPNRGIYYDEKNEPFTANLLTIEDQKWKNLRSKLSPAFTSGKIKAMTRTIVDITRKLQDRFDQIAENKEIVEVRELMAQNTTNVIASVAFGLEVDCIANPYHDFRKYGRKVSALNVKNALRGLFRMYSPKLFRISKLRSVDQDVEDYFMNIVKQNIKYREENNVVRKDFFQLLIQMKNGIDIASDDKWTNSRNGDEAESLTLNEVAAQAFLFYMAGLETSSTALAWLLYELAKSSECQRRLHEEIVYVLHRHNGEYTYESIGEMKYLEMCLEETMRLHPLAAVLTRESRNFYKIPDSDVVIEKGTPVLLAVEAAQRDPKYYPNPEKFDPERFSETSRADPEFAKRPRFAFGEGPRNCIGMRMGQIQTKIAAAMMLEKYEYELSDEMKNRKLALAPESIIIAPIGGVTLKVRKI